MISGRPIGAARTTLTAAAVVLGLIACGRATATEPSPQPPSSAQGGRPLASEPSPQDRKKALGSLYDLLATLHTEAESTQVVKAIEQLWLDSGSDTIDLLMSRATDALTDSDNSTARQLLGAVTKLAPDYAEGWNRRAALNFSEEHYEDALSDLARALKSDPRHFGALEGLAQTLKQLGRDALALKAFRQLQKAYPGSPGAEAGINELERKVEGQKI
mgnify:CR=1 FL=1